MNFRQVESPTDVRIELTALIDVIFLLLIFFLLTTSFITERTFEVELPGADATATSRERMTIVAVSVTSDGRVAHDDELVTWRQLSEVFRRAAAVDRDQIVVIRGDHAATHGRVVAVMDLARVHGLTKLAIATVPVDDELTDPPEDGAEPAPP